MEAVRRRLSELNLGMRKGCTAHAHRSGRLYYMNHETRTTSWLPPVECWDEALGLPYGWEAAVDPHGKTYFINHVNRTTTAEDPRRRRREAEEAEPREVELVRDPRRGFGFVAGSERPVVVRCVTEGGPSDGRLLPGDRIVRVNGEEVADAPRDAVIRLVRSCKHSVKLEVCQPITSNGGGRRSALLSATAKARYRSRPRVRFAEPVLVEGRHLAAPLPANVLKVFLENGQTKSFKFDARTTVQEVVSSLLEKLAIERADAFALALEHVRYRRRQPALLHPHATLSEVWWRPGAPHLRCVLRLAFPPVRDLADLLHTDPLAFDYLFFQCCNDVSRERFSPELRGEVALRLAALHLHERALAAGPATASPAALLKALEREYGLEKFVPASLLETTKRKEVSRLLRQLLKRQQRALATPREARFRYLRLLTELGSFGARTFADAAPPLRQDGVVPEPTALVIGPRIGIAQVSTIRNIAPIPLCQFGELEGVEAERDDHSSRLRLRLRHAEAQCLELSLEEPEAEELLLMLERFHLQATQNQLPVHWPPPLHALRETVPSYHGRHLVPDSPWSYCGAPSALRTVDLSLPPPPYVPCEERRLSRSESRDEFSAATSPAALDHNMNETLPPPNPDHTQHHKESGLCMHDVVSMEATPEGAAIEHVDVNVEQQQDLDIHVESPFPFHRGECGGCDSQEEEEETAAESDVEAVAEADVEALLRQLRDASSNLQLCLDPAELVDLTVVPAPPAGDVDFGCVTPDSDVDFGCVTPDSEVDLSCCLTPSSESGDVRTSVLDHETGQRSDEGQFRAPEASAEEVEEVDELSAYIIPPPPTVSARAAEEQDRVLARFREASEDVQRMITEGHVVSKFCTMPRRHHHHHLTVFQVAPQDEGAQRPRPPPRVKRDGPRTPDDSSQDTDRRALSLGDHRDVLDIGPKEPRIKGGDERAAAVNGRLLGHYRSLPRRSTGLQLQGRSREEELPQRPPLSIHDVDLGGM